MTKLLGGILGGAKPPKVDKQPVADTEDARKATQSARSALYMTEGGSQGSELDPNEVKKRDTLYGN